MLASSIHPSSETKRGKKKNGIDFSFPLSFRFAISSLSSPRSDLGKTNRYAHASVIPLVYEGWNEFLKGLSFRKDVSFDRKNDALNVF